MGHGSHCGSLSNHGAPPSDPLGLAMAELPHQFARHPLASTIQGDREAAADVVGFAWREVLSSLREQQLENESDGAALLTAASAGMVAGIIASLRVAGKR